MKNLDQKDTELLNSRLAKFNAVQCVRVGDYIRMLDGSLQRFSHDWGEDIQTTNGGSFYLSKGGFVEFSGGLNSAILKDTIILLDETMDAKFWFFRHNLVRAFNDVYFNIPVRVFQQIKVNL